MKKEKILRALGAVLCMALRILRIIFKWTAITVGGAVLAAIIVLPAAFWWHGAFAPPDFSRLEDRRESSILYDEYGEVMREYCEYCREIVSLEQMGRLPELTVAAEDKNFWNRWTPYDFFAMSRAFAINLIAGRIEQGGSTISQQTAGLLLAEEEMRRDKKSPTRWFRWVKKVREAYLATRLELYRDEKRGNKHDLKRWVLELYLNSVYCGDKHSQHYGVKSCSRYYFGKEPSDLTAGEAAIIIGTFRKPSASPFVNPAEAKELRARVLEQFAREEKITEQEQKEFAASSLPVRTIAQECHAAHAAEFIRRRITNDMRLVDEGLRIRSTVNCGIQRVAATSLKQSIDAIKSRNPELTDLRGVAILVDRYTGAIRALAQEPSFNENQFLVDQIQRHVGSAGKPFAYLALLLAGGRFTCEDEGTGPCRLNDAPGRDGKSAFSIYINKETGRHYIQNFPVEGLPRYLGWTSPLTAIARSQNAATVSMMKNIDGPALWLVSKEDIIELIVRHGVTLPARENDPDRVRLWLAQWLGISPNTHDPGHTVGLGSVDISPLQMVRAWTGLAGTMVEPFLIERIEHTDGSEIPFQKRAQSSPLETTIFERKKLKLMREETKKIWAAMTSAEQRKTSRDKLEKLAVERAFTPEILARFTAEAAKEAPAITLQLIRGLRGTVELPHGTGQRMKELGYDIAAKTGTATNNKGETTDNWFVACTTRHCMVVWIGREKMTSMDTWKILPDGTLKKNQETGGGNALRVVYDVFKFLYEGDPPPPFPAQTNPLKPFTFAEEKPEEPIPLLEEEKIEEDTNAF